MKTNTTSKTGKLLLAVLCFTGLAVTGSCASDLFGSGANTFSIGFVPIGNAGNAADTTGYGAVSYNYNISTYAIPQADIDAATAGGLTNATQGAWSGTQPAGGGSWYAAAAFVNWLNTSQGYTAAYDLTYSGSSWSMSLWSTSQAFQLGGGLVDLYRNANAHYFLSTEDEYYKAAYYDPNQGGVGVGGYWKYATGSNTVPAAVASGTASGTVVYNQNVNSQPAAVNNAGGLSPYGTIGQTGNVYEWMESSDAGDNSSASENRAFRSGIYFGSASYLISSKRGSASPASSGNSSGFRVVSVPESSTWAMLAAGTASLLALRRRKSK